MTALKKRFSPFLSFFSFGSRQRMGAAALLLAASALLSRLMGLVRDKIISWQFGASHEADMYFAAFVVPDIINYLLAGGFMSITLIPLLAKGFREDEANAWRFFSCVFFYILAAACLLTVLGEIWAIPLAQLVAPGFDPEQTLRLARFMRIILPGQIFFLTGACFTALLFLRRQFTMPALSPLIYNGCIIISGVTLPLVPGMASDFGMTGYCIGVGIGAFLGAFLMPWAAARTGGIHWNPVLWHPWLKRFLVIALPLMLGQTVAMLDEQFLRIFGSMLPEGNVSLLNYGRRIAQVPVSLMGQAIAVASYPFLIKLLADNDQTQFDATLNKALGAGIMLIIPCSLGMVAAAAPILGIIFEGGRFGAAETLACAPLTRLMLCAAPVWIVYMVIARAFYAHEDSITPALIGTIVTIIAIPCYYFLAVPLGAWAIALCSSLSMTAYAGWLLLIWKRRYGGDALQGLAAVTAKSIICSLPPAAAAWAVIHIFLAGFMPENPLLAQAVMLLLGGGAFALVFIPLAAILFPAILHKFLEIILRKRHS